MNEILLKHITKQKCFIFSGGLLKTDPQNLIYVDLNSILQSNCAILANFFNIIGDQNKTQQYNTLAQRFQVGIDTVSN